MWWPVCFWADWCSGSGWPGNPDWPHGLAGLSGGQVFGASVLVAGAMMVVSRGTDGYPPEDAATLGGILLGANVGVFYEMQRVRFADRGSWIQILGRLVVGLVLLVAVREGMALLYGVAIPDYESTIWLERTLRFVRYTVVGLTLTWWVPALFVRLGLASKIN